MTLTKKEEIKELTGECKGDLYFKQINDIFDKRKKINSSIFSINENTLIILLIFILINIYIVSI